MENARVVFSLKDGSCFEKSFSLLELDDCQYRLTISKELLDEKIEKVEIFVPFATVMAKSLGTFFNPVGKVCVKSN